MRRITTALLFLATLALPSLASAQAPRTDFSGTWELDAAQSERSPVVPPAMKYTITQDATAMTIVRVQRTPGGDVTINTRFTLDGTASRNELPGANGPVHMTTIVTLEAAGLVFTSDSDTGIHQVDRWTMLDGGKKLQVDRAVQVGEQAASGRMVMVRL